MQIVTDEVLLRRPCELASLTEGREIGRRLLAWVGRNNKRASKPPGLKRRLPRSALGVAAPQFGILRRVCVMDVCGRPEVMVNPAVTARSDTRVNFEEMCLSMPGQEVTTFRRTWVEVSCDNWASPRVFGPRTPAEWADYRFLLQAVVAQHEIAHCYGLLMTDFVKEDAPDPLAWGKEG